MIKTEVELNDGAVATYADAVEGGHYSLYRGGLSGKHDNVRCYWEDQLRGNLIAPHLHRLIQSNRGEAQGIRIADLGCGSGEGLRLLTSWTIDQAPMQIPGNYVLPTSHIESYTGCDLSEEMLDEGRRNFREWPAVEFCIGDLSRGFPLRSYPSFDLYFTSYSSFSHVDNCAMVRLMRETVEHAREGSVIVCDWLGEYSVEWPVYWGKGETGMLDYSMSWLYPDALSHKQTHFPMRYWSGEQVRGLASGISKATNIELKLVELADISSFVGRHVQTRLYNPWASMVRGAVNMLHEENVRTDLSSLRVEFRSLSGFSEANIFYSNLMRAWNLVLDFCMDRMKRTISPLDMPGWSKFPLPLQSALLTMERVFQVAEFLKMGDPRANVIEPQLGYVLRDLEFSMQQGLGCGHALVGVFKVGKKSN